MRKLHYCYLGIFLSTCMPKVAPDKNEISAFPIVEFDPRENIDIVPQPNDLHRDPIKGTVKFDKWCVEPKVLGDFREVYNLLDGFGNYQPTLSFTLTTEPEKNTFGETKLQADSLERVKLFCLRINGQDILAENAKELPYELTQGQTFRFDHDCQGVNTAVYQVTLTPVDPIPENSTCVVAVLTDDIGPVDVDGDYFSSSMFWKWASQEEKPVEISTNSKGEILILKNLTLLDERTESGRTDIKRISDLWDEYKPILDTLSQVIAWNRDGPAAPSIPRSQFLLAWTFTTQTIMDPFDPDIVQSPAEIVDQTPDELDGALDVITDTNNINQLFFDEIGATYQAANSTCTDYWDYEECKYQYTADNFCTDLFRCNSVGSIVRGAYFSPNFQSPEDNPGNLPDHLWPGRWNNPLKPTPNSDKSTWRVPFILFMPNLVQFPGPRPLVIFVPGTGMSKETLYNIAPFLAEFGMASVAIDWVSVGERGTQILDENDDEKCIPNVRCDRYPQCCAPALGGVRIDLTRDFHRQGLMDLLKLIRVLKQCGASSCNGISIDPTRIAYFGQSQGAILGTILGAISNDIDALALNTPGMGFTDIIFSRDSACNYVDLLIQAGVLFGELSNNGTNPNALCLKSTWKDQPGFKNVAGLVQWLWDPVDPANFATITAQRLNNHELNVFVQEIENDATVPNETTEKLARIFQIGSDLNGDGLTDPADALQADSSLHPADLPAPTDSVNTEANPWIIYRYLEPRGTFPGNVFWHGNLYTIGLDEASDLGGARQRSDAIYFLQKVLAP